MLVRCRPCCKGWSIFFNQSAPQWTVVQNDALLELTSMQNIIYRRLVQWANFVAVSLDSGCTWFDWFASIFEPKWAKRDPRESNLR